MAKARMLSTKASTDPDLNSMSVEAELMFLLTIPHLDRDGLISGDPIPLWAKVAPRRVELMDKMPRVIQEWVEHNLVVRYDWKDGAILFFPGFRKHNPNMFYEREPVSEFPPPPNFHRSEHGLIPNDLDIAGHLAQQFDARSRYYAALMEASQDAKVDILNTSGSPQDVIRKSSGEAPAEVEVEQQTEVETEVEVKNNNSALRELTMAEAEKAVVVVGAGALIASFDDDQVMALLSWLWLYNGWHQDDWRFRDLFRRAYERDPFAGMKQPGAVMVAQAKARAPAPLAADDRAELAERLRAMQEPAHD